jgi:hypothetical protein
MKATDINMDNLKCLQTFKILFPSLLCVTKKCYAKADGDKIAPSAKGS